MDGQAHIGCVREIAEFFVPGRSLLRVLLHIHVRDAHHVDLRMAESRRRAVITLDRASPACEKYLCCENVAMHEVHCDDSQQHVLTFMYIYESHIYTNCNPE